MRMLSIYCYRDDKAERKLWNDKARRKGKERMKGQGLSVPLRLNVRSGKGVTKEMQLIQLEEH